MHLGVCTVDRADGINAVRLGHVQVDEHYVGSEGANLVQRLTTVSRLANYDEIRFGIDQAHERETRQGVIIDDQD